jgi:hypothetical protein
MKRKVAGKMRITSLLAGWGEEGIVILKGLQVSPAHPSDKSSKKKKKR